MTNHSYFLTALFLLAAASPASAVSHAEPDPIARLTQDPVTGGETVVSDQLANDDEPLAAALMLKMRSGRIHWGHILSHDPDGFVFALLSHGGQVSVSWGALDPTQMQALKVKYGYNEVSEEELLVDVDRLVLVDGREVVGVILSREGSDFVVQVSGNLQLVPKGRVQTISRGGQLPALDIYSREELYTRYSSELDPGDIQAQIDLAHTCEKILDFEHAVEHYTAAQALDVDGLHAELPMALAKATVKAAQQAQIDYLRAVDVMRKKGQYEEALAQLADFSKVFPDSPLLDAAQVKEKQVLLARDEELTDFVRRRWGIWLSRLCRKGTGDITYAQAVAYAEEGLGEAIRAGVLADVQSQFDSKASEDQIVAHWVARKKLRYANASYGEGTWLLGEDRAHAGTESDSAQKEPVSAKDKERADLEEKIQRFLKNQRAARRAMARADQEDEFEAFWAGFSLNDRAGWIRSFYVEFSGDYELRDHPYLKACSSCGGKGVNEIIYSGGAGQNQKAGVQIVACSNCRGMGVTRRVYYR